jgi:hypothetical protein
MRAYAEPQFDPITFHYLWRDAEGRWWSGETANGCYLIRDCILRQETAGIDCSDYDPFASERGRIAA